MENKDWFSNILGQICKALSSFITIFKKHGVLYTLIMMILFIVFYSAIINPIKIGDIIEKKMTREYKKFKEIEQAEMQMSIEKRLQANHYVSDVIQKLVDRYQNIDRVLLCETHNSIQSISGLHFTYISCSYETLSPNSREFNYLSDDLQRQMIVNLIGQNLYNTLIHRSYVFYDNIKQCKHADHRLIHKLAQYSDETILIPFLNDKKQMAMLLVISGNNLPIDDIVEYVNDFKKQIEDCLM